MTHPPKPVAYPSVPSEAMTLTNRLPKTPIPNDVLVWRYLYVSAVNLLHAGAGRRARRTLRIGTWESRSAKDSHRRLRIQPAFLDEPPSGVQVDDAVTRRRDRRLTPVTSPLSVVIASRAMSGRDKRLELYLSRSAPSCISTPSGEVGAKLTIVGNFASILWAYTWGANERCAVGCGVVWFSVDRPAYRSGSSVHGVFRVNRGSERGNGLSRAEFVRTPGHSPSCTESLVQDAAGMSHNLLPGKVVVVTGSSTGIGRGIVIGPSARRQTEVLTLSGCAEWGGSGAASLGQGD